MTPEPSGRPAPSSPLAALWSARSVAVVGASDRPGSLGRLPVEFLQRYGYAGRILPVRPDGEPVAGLPSYASVRECRREHGAVDLAMVMVAAPRVLAAVQDCAEAEVPVAVICTSGFAETGAEGAALQAEVVRAAHEGGVRLVGPNCIGSVGVAAGQVSSFSPLFSGERTELVPGAVGFVSQSGALGYGAVSLAFERGLGLGWVVNTGNEADVSAVEVMGALSREPGCRGLLAYLETLGDFEGLRAVAAAGTPVAVLKAGRSDAGARAAASHTGALAAGDRVVDAALRQLGIVRVDDVDELLDVGDVMTVPHRPRGRRVAVVTTSGGSGILAADAVEAHGLEMAALSEQTLAVLDEIVPAFGSTANPVDVTAAVMSNASLFDRTLDVIADDPGVDLIVACFCVLTGTDVDDVVASLARVAEGSGIPVLAVRTGADHLAPQAGARMRAAGIPCYPTPARAVRAAAALVRFSTPPPSPPSAPGASPAADAVHAVHAIPRAGAGEQELKGLLAAAGLPVPAGRVAASAADAATAVADVGGRAVFKAVVPGLLHKSDAGGVIVGVTAEEAGPAWEKVAALGGAVLVEEMVSGGVEALVGLAPSPLGTVLTVGVGGVLTEVLHDVALRVLPVGRDDVEGMVDETRLGALLAGVRGAAPADREALVGAVLRVCEVTRAWPQGFELDLNPVTALAAGNGVRVLDAAYFAPPGHQEA
jgi:acyl-CoA synthetase (NDP forming)